MILVDSNVLIDVTGQGSAWKEWSARALADASDREGIAINPIIYAEISMGYARADELDPLLTSVRRLPLPYEAAFAAGKAFLEYRRRGGARSAPLPDFYIGAHAAIEGMRLLTRDPSRYASYFPKLTLIAP
jgi:predicted nucleic acid-binding protein